MLNSKAIAGLVAFAVLAPIAAWNWWSYYQEEQVSAPRPAATAARAPAAAAGAAPPAARSTTAQSRAAAQGTPDDIPKRAPLNGDMAVDPFGWAVGGGRVAGIAIRHGMTQGVGSATPAAKPSLELQMIMVDGERRWAALSGNLYRVGDRVGGAVIAEIQVGEVVLIEGDGRRRTLDLRDRIPVGIAAVATADEEGPSLPGWAGEQDDKDGSDSNELDFDDEEDEVRDDETQRRDESENGGDDGIDLL